MSRLFVRLRIYEPEVGCFKSEAMVYEFTPARVYTTQLWPPGEFRNILPARANGEQHIQGYMQDKYGVGRQGYRVEVAEPRTISVRQ